MKTTQTKTLKKTKVKNKITKTTLDKNLKKFLENAEISNDKKSKKLSTSIKNKAKKSVTRSSNKALETSLKKANIKGESATKIKSVAKNVKLKFSVIRVIIFICVSVLLCSGIFVFQKPLEMSINRQSVANSTQIDYDGLVVHFLNVEQADGIVIELPDDKVMLIDTGDGSSDSTGYLIKYIDSNILTASKQIDYLLLTHSDSDHSGGLEKIFNTYDILTFYRPTQYASDISNDGTITQRVTKTESSSYNVETSKCYNRGISASLLEGCNIVFSTAGLTIPSIPSTENYLITFYSPISTTFVDKNNFSPVIVLEYNNKRIMLSGDSETEGEQEAITNLPDEIDIDVIKLGHHGSKTSTTQALLDKIDTSTLSYAVVSCGKGNKYNHPHAEALNRVAYYIGEDKILRTDVNGNIIANITTDGDLVMATDVQNLPVFVEAEYIMALVVVITFFVCFNNYKKTINSISKSVEIKI